MPFFIYLFIYLYIYVFIHLSLYLFDGSFYIFDFLQFTEMFLKKSCAIAIFLGPFSARINSNPSMDELWDAL